MIQVISSGIDKHNTQADPSSFFVQSSRGLTYFQSRLFRTRTRTQHWVFCGYRQKPQGMNTPLLTLDFLDPDRDP